MIITAEKAQAIVNELKSVIGNNINLMNHEGSIIASIDPNRIGTIHEGALEVIRTNQEYFVQTDDEYKGVKQGINLPVRFQSKVVAVIGLTGTEEEAKQYGNVIKKMTEILIKESYLEEQAMLEKKAKDSFLEEWIKGKIENKKLFTSRGWMLGINVHLPRVVAVIDFIGFHEYLYENLHTSQLSMEVEFKHQKLRRNVLHVIEDFFKYEQQDFVLSHEASKFVLFISVDPKRDMKHQKQTLYSRLKQLTEMIIEQFELMPVIGIGKVCENMNDQEKSYKEALRAVRQAKKENEIVFYNELGLEILIEEIPVQYRQDFINRMIPFVQEQDSSQLIETLDIFFRYNQSINEASENLFIHKNTLQYRLRKIKDLTGYDPRKFTDGVLLYVALALFRSENNR
ncbi:hypothetical protein BKP37_01335 [Anaerobacillus alkalilacustris]|uniref:Carbohydrate diacid regulator n=1 Tax=Anaerobacillus alkalilacustris TaxID=393763 RepID=A0A1S2LXG3_9BACI|nr:sugar diacid recognition domain-containing protein [Anaerobacillus alkalilacustris]OIJ17202.1 hypothetical protein BKP37_01335 [Anaerobacillus alkalilacustris]